MKLSMTTLEALNIVNKTNQLKTAYDAVVTKFGPVPESTCTDTDGEEIVITPTEKVKEESEAAGIVAFILSTENSLDYGILDITKAADEVSFEFKKGFFNEFVDAYCKEIIPLLKPMHKLMIKSRKADFRLAKVVNSYITKK